MKAEFYKWFEDRYGTTWKKRHENLDSDDAIDFADHYLKQWLKENVPSDENIKNELDNDFKDKWNHGRGIIELRPSSTNFYRVQGVKWLKNHINKLIKE